MPKKESEDLVVLLLSEIKEEVKEVRSAQTRHEVRLDSIDVTLKTQALVLEDHVKRTKQLEDRVEPIEKTVGFASTIGKAITWIAGCAGGLIGVFKFVMHFFFKH